MIFFGVIFIVLLALRVFEVAEISWSIILGALCVPVVLKVFYALMTI